MGRLWPTTKREDEPAHTTYESIQDHLQSYPSHIPPKLRELDTLRLQEIPEKLAQRKQAGEAFLEKSEVIALVEWKLKHGTYRPNLANLVASNSEDAIRSTTKSAFATYEADNDSYNDSLKTLTKLKGIGPATASLLLSCHDPLKVPFFSDQLFRYSLWIRTHGQGWDRKIKYSISEYVEMFGKVEALRERLGKESGETVSALDLEKVAYVLAKEAKPGSKRYDVEGDGGDEEKDPQLEGPTKKRKGTASKVEVAKKGPTQQPNTKRRRKGPADVADED